MALVVLERAAARAIEQNDVGLFGQENAMTGARFRGTWVASVDERLCACGHSVFLLLLVIVRLMANSIADEKYLS